MQVSDVMSRNVTVVSPDDTLEAAAFKMDQFNVGALPVCNGDRLVGIVSDRDMVVRCMAAGAPPDRTPVAQAMTEEVCWCFADDPIEEVEEAMQHMQIRRMPVVDGHKRLIGMVSLGDLATDRAPGSEDTLRAISEPSEPDRSSALRWS